MRIKQALWVLLFCAALAAAQAAQTAPASQFFDSGGVKIHYLVQGKGEPVVLVHGYGANVAFNWQAPGIFKALAENYRVIALDNRGHGRSDKPADPAAYGVQMVDDVVRLLDHLKIPKAHIIGYSMGGFITNKLLATYPDRVISATLGGAGWMKPDQPPVFLEQLAQSLEEGKGLAVLMVALTPRGQQPPPPEVIEQRSQMFMAMNDAKALAAVARRMHENAVPEEKLKANKVPTLALVGDVDPLKDGVDELEKVMASLKVIVVKGDHLTALSNPEFTASLKTFLGEQAGKAKKSAASGTR